MMGTLCTFTTAVLVYFRIIGARRQSEEFLTAATVTELTDSRDKLASLSVSTAHSIPRQPSSGTLRIFPQLLTLRKNTCKILRLKNTHHADWIAVRIRINNPVLSVHPAKILIPPGRISAVSCTEVTMKAVPKGRMTSQLLVQWFSVGVHCPARNVNSLWTRPYSIPRKQWHYKMIRVQLEAN
ncbi:unnamed protein product [Gongylonema pulchrum]|uniref:Major sperm protein n=1 Tax=Gongylonema pulchrum TaxID=637853 RepID=A0A3P7MBX8_9BILA|nr:unnamed protein product [Gongylonema pulchrum]